MPRLAVYPGSFDPLTNGHVDIITRGARLFDRIIVAMLVNAEKQPLFSMAERVEIAREVFRDQPNVEVDTFDGLLVDYAARRACLADLTECSSVNATGWACPVTSQRVATPCRGHQWIRSPTPPATVVHRYR